jgi:hypothetical protein
MNKYHIIAYFVNFLNTTGKVKILQMLREGVFRNLFYT